MTPERYQRVGDLYHAVLDRPAAQRPAYLAAACGDDSGLRREVESLLVAHERGEGFLSTAAAAASTPAVPVAGRRLGHYQVMALLGAGGMGEVYLAEDVRLARRVALKWLPASVTSDPQRVRRFEQEARAASALNHPNIVTIHDIGVADTGRYLVMELVEGRTLRAIIAEGAAAGDVPRIGAQVAGALAVAHAGGITHRDIKPENLMVRHDGYVKVLDFGLARLSAGAGHVADGDPTGLTHPGVLLGTLRYMSPEQARGDSVSAPSDVFSLGIVLYELATGRHPFAAPSMLSTLQAITSRTPEPPSRWTSDLPEALDRLILRMLSRAERARPDAVEVAAALNELARPRTPTRPAVTAVAPSTRHLVGHQRERREVGAGLAEARAGRGVFLGLVGEPGIGKSTLVDDFLAGIAMSGEPTFVGRGRSSERLAGTEAYLPWLEILEALCVTGREPVVEALRRMAPTWFLQVSSVLDDSSGERLQAERAQSPERMKRELRAFFQALAQERPVVLVLEDLHWADASTVDLLAFLADRLSGMALLLVATYRPSEMLIAKHPFLRVKLDLQTRGACREIVLDFLSADDVRQYLALECPGHRMPATLADWIHARTEGSPLFMADLVRYLRERGVIAFRDGVWTLAGTLETAEHDLPASVRGMVELKVAQLGEEDRQLLVAASVKGHEFDSATLARVLGVDGAAVEERLEILDRVHAFVSAVDERELHDGTLTIRYRFVHVLYQNALYGSLGPARRAQLSRATADALAHRQGTAAPAVLELANLYETARDPDKASEYFLTAATHAAGLFAYQETAALARRGLALLERLPDDGTRQRRELDLLTVLGPALIATRGYAAPEVAGVYERARVLSERADDPQALFVVLYNTWLTHDLRGDFGRGRDVASQCLQLADRVNDESLRMMSQWILGETALWTGEFEAARDHFEAGNSAYDFSRHHGLALLHGGYDPGIGGRAIGAHAHWYLGFADRALVESRAGLAVARRSAHAHSLALALCHAALLHHLRRETADAGERATAALELAADQGLTFWVAYARVLRGRALVGTGENDTALALMAQGIAEYRALGSEVEVPLFAAFYAEGCLALERPSDGLRMVEGALDFVERQHVCCHEAELRRLRGELLARSGRNDPEAELEFRRAMDVARRQSARMLELRAAMSLSRFLEDRAGPADADAALRSIFDGFTEGLDTADLLEARTRLDSRRPR